MIQQEPLTIITPVHPGQVDSLLATMKKINFEVEHHLPERLEEINTIHFARWLLIDYDQYDSEAFDPGSPKLVFSSNFDGKASQQLLDLCEKSTPIIDMLYGHCIGYPLHDADTEAKVNYLHEHSVKPSAFYRGSPGRSVKQIRLEDRLHGELRNFLNDRSFEGKTAVAIHRELKSHIESLPEFNSLRERVTLPRINWFGMIFIGIILLILLPILIIWVLLVQFGYERHDKHFTKKRSDLSEKQIRDLEEYEDLEIQNQFSQLVRMKPGWVRLTTYKSFMLLARGLIRFQFVEGKLMGIPTIHFARWVLFDDNKRVLFFSNFDGSWQQYLGDFIDQSGWGLTGIFSNTRNFPKTRFLLTGGAYDEEHFLAWSRNSEIKTHIWYSAYPHLSIKNVNNNTRIRVGLSKDLNDKQASKFLQLI